MGAQLYESIKTSEFCILNELIVWYVNYTSIKIFFLKKEWTFFWLVEVGKYVWVYDNTKEALAAFHISPLSDSPSSCHYTFSIYWPEKRRSR